MLYYDENIGKVTTQEQLASRGLALDKGALKLLNIYEIFDIYDGFDEELYFKEYGSCIKSDAGDCYTRIVTPTLKPLDELKRVLLARLDLTDSLANYGRTYKDSGLMVSASSIKHLYLAMIWARDFSAGKKAIYRNDNDSWSEVGYDDLATAHQEMSKLTQYLYETKARRIAAVNDCRSAEELFSLFAPEEVNN